MRALRWLRAAAAGVLALTVLGAATGVQALRAHQNSSTTKATVSHGVVSYIVDGDTIHARVGGQDVSVRVLGISAPEVAHEGTAAQCYGDAATKTMAKYAPVGAKVTLTTDPSQAETDAYGRWLRYLTVAGHDVGLEQIVAGSAAARESNSPVERFQAYARAARAAKAKNAGMWGACSK